MKKVEVPVSNIHTLDDYFEEKEMEIIRSKLSIMDYQPSKANAKENAPLSDQKEDILIHEGEILLDKFNKPLKPAFPASDDIIESDKHELKTAITALEKIDKDHYQSDEYEQIDMGKGMLYDSISRKLNKIIKTNNMKELLFVQAEKIENEAFNVVKHLEHDDFLETLKLMKEVGTIKEIIEINPQTNLLILSKNTIRLSIAEKVVISFIANSDKHSLDDLKELTGWKPLFTNQIIEKLQEKSILSIENKILKISGLLTSK